MKKFKQEKGSMAVYVAIALISFVMLLSVVYFSLIGVRKRQLKTTLKIKESYELNEQEIEQIYENQVKKDGTN